MGQLQALQNELRRVLFIGSSVESSPLWKEGMPKRLQVYRNTVHGNAYDTLDSDYAMTKKQFTDDEWFDLSEAFFKKHPPSYWELNNCITAFPKFLKSKKVKPYIVELATYELLDLSTFIHTAEVKKGMGVTNPTLATHVFQYQMFDWAVAKAPPEKTPEQRPEVLVFYRNTKHDCYIRRADPYILLVMDHFKKPGAHLHDLDSAVEALVPGNNVSLHRVLDDLVENDLILL